MNLKIGKSKKDKIMINIKQSKIDKDRYILNIGTKYYFHLSKKETIHLFGRLKKLFKNKNKKTK